MLEFTVCTSTSFCVWPEVVPYLLSAVRVFRLFEMLLCRYRIRLGSVRPWRRCLLWQSCTTLVSTCPLVTWPVAVVTISIACSVHSHGFPTISTWVRCPVFRFLVHFQTIFVMLMAISLVIVLNPLLTCIFAPGDLTAVPTIQSQGRQCVWLLPFWSPGYVEAIESSIDHQLWCYSADVETEGDWDLSDWWSKLRSPCLSRCCLWPALRNVPGF